ncbi:MAG: hypothetical protein QOI01_7 [Mycobacterium sp.]|nr:hypothetical protein [Mycobacterium sp.]
MHALGRGRPTRSRVGRSDRETDIAGRPRSAERSIATGRRSPYRRAAARKSLYSTPVKGAPADEAKNPLSSSATASSSHSGRSYAVPPSGSWAIAHRTNGWASRHWSERGRYSPRRSPYSIHDRASAGFMSTNLVPGSMFSRARSTALSRASASTVKSVTAERSLWSTKAPRVTSVASARRRPTASSSPSPRMSVLHMTRLTSTWGRPTIHFGRWSRRVEDSRRHRSLSTSSSRSSSAKTASRAVVSRHRRSAR